MGGFGDDGSEKGHVPVETLSSEVADANLAKDLVKRMEEEFGQRGYHGCVAVVGTTSADVIARAMQLFKESRGSRIAWPVLEPEVQFGGLVIRFRPRGQVL